jgi:MORN repeat
MAPEPRLPSSPSAQRLLPMLSWLGFFILLLLAEQGFGKSQAEKANERGENAMPYVLPNGDISYRHVIYWDGRIYDGEAKLTEVSGAPDGEGVMTWLDGRKYTGQFRDGKMDGRGILIYPDGKVEKGLWKDDKFVGASISL